MRTRAGDAAQTITRHLQAGQQFSSAKLQNSTEAVVGRVKKHQHIAINVGVVLFVGVLIFLGSYTRPDNSRVSYRFGYGGGPVTVDEVSSADVAAEIAQQGNMLIADNVKNLADSIDAQVKLATTNNSYITKPQLIVTSARTREDIATYVVQRGDTISSIAADFNVTSDTIRWANNLSGDSVSPGLKLTIPPVTGVLYTVQSGDTAESIASRFRANKEQIIAFNDAELRGFRVGERIVVPGGVKVEAATTTRTFFSSGSVGWSFGSEALYGGNGYAYGYCTYWVALRRQQIGRPIPRNLGNAATWAALAPAAGLSVSGTPRAGAVLWVKNIYISGGLGHVGFVESVNGNGSIKVSDMNYPIWNTVAYRTIPPSEFGEYLFIY